MRDDTDRKTAEDALRDSEQKFAGVIALCGDAFVAVDDEQCIIIFNDEAEKVFGYSRREALENNVAMLLPERFRDAQRERLREFAAGRMAGGRQSKPGEDDGHALIARRKSGEEFPAEFAISRMTLRDKAIVSVVLRDVTERRRCEDEQTFLERAWSTLVSSLDPRQAIADLAVLVVNTLGTWCIVDMVEADGTVRRLTAKSPEPGKADLSARFEAVAIDPARPHLTRGPLTTRRSVLISEVPADFLRSLAQDEEQRKLLEQLKPHSLMAVPLLARGRLVGAMAFISTDPHREFGKRDLRLVEELARRTALAVDNARLFQAAQNAIHARDEFMGIVAHDLRNLLNTIVMSATVIERELSGGPEGSPKPVKSMVQSADRMNRLLRDLLDVSSIEAGQLSLDRHAYPARQLILDVLEATAPTASHRLEPQLPGDLPEVYADSDRIMEVFFNLIGNADKFTPPGGRITVGADPRPEGVCFRVADTGPGIPEKDLAHVFDRFWRAHAKVSPGSGLGLAICKAIIEGHGGRIWAESKPGTGSTFFFTLPYARDSHSGS